MKDGEKLEGFDALYVACQEGMNKEIFVEYGITHVLSFTCDLARFPGITYLSIELTDNIGLFIMQVNEFIDRGMSSGAIVIHCDNENLKPSIAIMGVLMNQKGMNFEDAYSFVKSNNFCTELNENLKKQLTSYEEIRGGSQGVGEKLKTEHKLQSSWTFWFARKSNRGNQNYGENLKRIGTFDTIEGFWRHYSFMQRPENVPYDHNYHCFRETVIPMWESFPQGACWILKVEKNSGVLATLWEKILFAAIGEVFGTPNVVGVVLSFRAREDFISVWIKDSSNPMSWCRIGEKMKKLLGVDPKTVLEYKTHDTSMKDRSSFRNADSYLL